MRTAIIGTGLVALFAAEAYAAPPSPRCDAAYWRAGLGAIGKPGPKSGPCVTFQRHEQTANTIYFHYKNDCRYRVIASFCPKVGVNAQACGSWIAMKGGGTHVHPIQKLQTSASVQYAIDVKAVKSPVPANDWFCIGEYNDRFDRGKRRERMADWRRRNNVVDRPRKPQTYTPGSR